MQKFALAFSIGMLWSVSAAMAYDDCSKIDPDHINERITCLVKNDAQTRAALAGGANFKIQNAGDGTCLSTGIPGPSTDFFPNCNQTGILSNKVLFKLLTQ